MQFDLRNSFAYMTEGDVYNMLRERNSIISNLILCRALLPIVAILEKDAISAELFEKIEEMCFIQLKKTDVHGVSQSINRLNNINLFSELLGELSRLRFGIISDRFVSDIGKGGMQLNEGRLEIMVRSMRFLKMKMFPMDALEESAELLQTLAELFQDTHSARIKTAYAELFVSLLDGVAGIASAEMYLPTWQKTIEIIFPKALRMMSRPRYLMCTLPLITTVICTSRKDFFLNHWGSTVKSLIQRFRDPSLKGIALQCIVNLIWVYLFRCYESPASSVQKQIKSIFKVIFPMNRRIMPAGCDLRNFVQVLYFILVKYPDFANEDVLSGFLANRNTQFSESNFNVPSKGVGDSESDLQSTTELDTRAGPERLIIVLQSFLLFLHDVETFLDVPDIVMAAAKSSTLGSETGIIVEGRISIPQPQYPSINSRSNSKVLTLDQLESILHRANNENTEARHIKIPLNTPLKHDVYWQMGRSIRETLGKINFIIGRAIVSLDQSIGPMTIFETGHVSPGMNSLYNAASSGLFPGSILSAHNGTTGSNSNDGFGSIGSTGISSYGTIEKGGSSEWGGKERIHFELLRVILECIPRYVPTINASITVEILSRLSINGDAGVSQAALDALLRIASIEHGSSRQNTWSLSTEEEHVSAGIIRIYIGTTMGFFDKQFSEFKWVHTSFPFVTEVVNKLLLLVQVWREKIKSAATSPSFKPNIREYRQILNYLDSFGLIIISGSTPNFRSNGIRVLKMAHEINSELDDMCKNFDCAFGDLPISNSFRETFDSAADHVNSTAHNLSEGAAPTGTKPALNPVRIFRIMSYFGKHMIRDDFAERMPFISFGELSKSEKVRNKNILSLLNKDDCLAFIAASDDPDHAIIWKRCFPEVLKRLLEYASAEVLNLALNTVCIRIELAQRNLVLNEVTANSDQQAGGANMFTAIWSNFVYSEKPKAKEQVLSEIFIEQWRNHLVFAGVCLTSSRNQSQERQSNLFTTNHRHSHGSTSMRPSPRKAMFTLEDLFGIILPSLASENASIGQAVSAAIGSVNWTQYPVLFDALRPYIIAAVEDLKSRTLSGRSDRTLNKRTFIIGSLKLEGKRLDRVLEEILHILTLVADFVDYSFYRQSQLVMPQILDLIQAITRFLSDPEVQCNLDYQGLRYYFCCFIEKFYYRLARIVRNRVADSRQHKRSTSNPESLNKDPQESKEIEWVESYIDFAHRMEIFYLLECWCGLSASSKLYREREARAVRQIIEQVKDNTEYGDLMSSIEFQRNAVEVSSLRAMASLCIGAVNFTEQHAQSLGQRRIMDWIDNVLRSQNIHYHKIARKALVFLLRINHQDEQFMEEILSKCYLPLCSEKASTGYFEAFVDFIVSTDFEYSFPRPFKILCLALLYIGANDQLLRRGAGHLVVAVHKRFLGREVDSTALAANVLEILERRVKSHSFVDSSDAIIMLGDKKPNDRDAMCSDDDEMSTYSAINNLQFPYETLSIVSSLTTVYQKAQYVISKSFADQIPGIACAVFAELVDRLETIVASPTYSRSILSTIHALAPWIRHINLKGNFHIDLPPDQMRPSNISPKAKPALSMFTKELPKVAEKQDVETEQAITFMVMSNMVYLTERFGDEFNCQIEALWICLIDMSSAPSAVNTAMQNRCHSHVQIIVDFMIMLGLHKRNPRLITVAKKICVFLGRTYANETLVDRIMAKIEWENMILVPKHLSRLISTKFTIIKEFRPVNLGNILRLMPDQPLFSVAQLAFTFLVDSCIESNRFVLLPHLPCLIHIIFVHLDCSTYLLCDQSRTFLASLIQLILAEQVQTRDLIESVLRTLHSKNRKRLWVLEENLTETEKSHAVKQVSAFADNLCELFSTVHQDFRQCWGKIALDWGINIPEKHVSIRSLQIFKVCSPTFQRKDVGTIIQKLSTTLGGDKSELLWYSMELLDTLDAMVSYLSKDMTKNYPQIFWACVASLSSNNDCEVEKSSKTLLKIMQQLDLEDPFVFTTLQTSFPSMWKGEFSGIQSLVIKGLYSEKQQSVALGILNRGILLRKTRVIDPIKTSQRLVCLLANLPRMMRCLERKDGEEFQECTRVVHQLSHFFTEDEVDQNGKFKEPLSSILASFGSNSEKEEIEGRIFNAIYQRFFPKWTGFTLKLLVGYLQNKKEVGYVLTAIERLFMNTELSGSTFSRFQIGTPKRFVEGFPIHFDENWVGPLLELCASREYMERCWTVLVALFGKQLQSSDNIREVMNSRKIQDILQSKRSTESSATENEGHYLVSRSNLETVAAMCVGGDSVLMNATGTALDAEKISAFVNASKIDKPLPIPKLSLDQEIEQLESFFTQVR